jgi:hypothetical protein
MHLQNVLQQQEDPRRYPATTIIPFCYLRLGLYTRRCCRVFIHLGFMQLALRVTHPGGIFAFGIVPSFPHFVNASPSRSSTQRTGGNGAGQR